ncbi:DNA-directed RNA polymerase subunit delta [Lactiplantibacillus plantarum]|uniref:Probable DNA-directed RNA polymerase subunit delta n=1 Tax=Lactiplantibacillus plantarum (strain ATCC BAA-793 / NCIMB 8826 / WCFS1) TaxID=220668 RepID=RPOE_LACPL|nr:DNA-directed RNA polymerase subunit delta [Lactiplantibacillus plantarum]Q88Z77.1 RecName: Full=Probable DNA-directed RNA polymerase subunit delta; AltName: Full=RNAP delta factor [Lactiplantibacillus plantarum WCFS1]MDE4414901.1 DNA-directed RNA polymerase subunit delta [Lactiplantibacillus plantarum]MDE4417327.1 DNA-directed RNA polymerase subunit delta [Lactiplantibacillus plantarum]MDE4420784.1 DNA-directed RNA polymerase subunit delta [Lactiplantibacillus plantarum]MDE4423738.1 DNA-dir
MELKQFDGQKKSELSLIEVAHAILSQHGDVMAFADLTNAVQSYLGKSDEEIRERLSQFYTDLNIDGSFISLGDNMWGLRAWYPFESIDEAVIHTDDDEDEDRPKRKKVNAFLADAGDDDDVIDYDDDDPEDDDNYDDDDDQDDDTDDSASSKYDELAGVDDTDDDVADETLPDGIEGQLSELNDDDDDDDYDDEDDESK